MGSDYEDSGDEETKQVGEDSWDQNRESDEESGAEQS